MGRTEKPLKFVTREEWGAEPPKYTEPLELPVAHALFTYTDTRSCRTREECLDIIQEIQQDHMEKKNLPDIAFNFILGGDGSVYEGRGWNVKPFLPDKSCKNPEYEGRSIEIAYMGDFADDDRFPSQDVLRVKDQLVKLGIEKSYIKIELPGQWEWAPVVIPDEEDPMFITASLVPHVPDDKETLR